MQQEIYYLRSGNFLGSYLTHKRYLRKNSQIIDCVILLLNYESVIKYFKRKLLLNAEL